MIENVQWMMKPKIGRLHLVASDEGLQGLFWKRQAAPLAASLDGKRRATRTLSEAVRQLEEYLEGARTTFELSLDLRGSAFQKQVWGELQRLSYGETISYLQLARRIKRATAARAVGSANGKNPLCIIVPCHRVIASDGSLGGYSGGLELKSRLLRLELENRSQAALR